jgi:hypothetical protein
MATSYSMTSRWLSIIKLPHKSSEMSGLVDHKPPQEGAASARRTAHDEIFPPLSP